MPETGEKPRRRRRASTSGQKKPRRGASKAAEDTADTATDTAGEATGAAGKAAGAAGDAAGGADGKATVTGALMDTIRGAAIEVLQPVVKEAATSAAKVAADKGPDLVKGKLGPAVASAGGVGGLAKMAADKGGDLVGGITDKVGGGKGGKSPSGTGRGRRLPVQEHVDVGVDLETAYDQWTQFEEFPRFMHRVEKVEQRDDVTLMWHENIWGVRRQWEAEIIEQIPCERIEWRSTGGPKVTGVVTFHRLSDTLTRVQVNLDFQPQGLFEKTASGFRMSRRALKSDLMRFKAYIEMRGEPTGEWRGEIEDGDVVDEDEARFSKDDEEPEDEAELDDEEELDEEDEDEEEPDEEEDEEPEAEADEEEEEEEEKKPAPRARKKRSSSSNGRAKSTAKSKAKPKSKSKSGSRS
jgi:uncharacterized membrane protein